MFDGRYLDWNQKRIKGIIDFYGHKFMFYKKVLDLGCGHADISGVLHRLGSDITAVDSRQEHLKLAEKKYPGIKTVKADLDRGLPFKNQQFDLVLDMDLICHLKDYETHLRAVCAAATHLILETAVCDSEDPFKATPLPENKAVYDLSFNGMGNLPTANAIERILSECGMVYRRQDNSRYNSGSYVYDWEAQNDGKCNVNNRRLWFAHKHNSAVKFATHPARTVMPPTPNPADAVQNSASKLISPNQIGPAPSAGDKKFVVVIPSYNNQRWCEKNIQSALDQNYNNYRVIFTDDCSKDNTFDKVSAVVSRSSKSNKVTLIKNDVRLGALENLYNMIHSCDDDEIILTLDGDDWFPDGNVLNKLNKIYSDKADLWMTYGQYKNHPDGGIGCAQVYNSSVVAANTFRQSNWGATHLRTFYTWLFKKIKKEDLFYDGKFMTMTWDAAIMYPMLEMAGTHSRFVPEILYVYNLENPINDHKVDVALQQKLDHYCRTMPKYSRVDKPVLSKTKVGLMLIATGKYHRFIQGLVSSADNFFLKDCDVTYYLLSDAHQKVHSSRNVVQINIPHKTFPYASMDRFKHFTNNADKLSNEDYLYYVDVDCLFVDTVSKEILGDLVGTEHCGYINLQGPLETNPASNFYIEKNTSDTIYYGGGFSGGRRSSYLELARWCYEKIEDDLSKGIMPVWHDETAINKYFYDHKPNIVLTPSYHYPQNSIERFKKIWHPQDFKPKILLLDKNHAEMRK